MTPQQIEAFNNAAGFSANELAAAIVLILFVTVSLWAVILFIGKMKHLFAATKGDFEFGKLVWGALQILGVIIMILILVH